jgi:hypothetical protein
MQISGYFLCGKYQCLDSIAYLSVVGEVMLV